MKNKIFIFLLVSFFVSGCDNFDVNSPDDAYLIALKNKEENYKMDKKYYELCFEKVKKDIDSEIKSNASAGRLFLHHTIYDFNYKISYWKYGTKNENCAYQYNQYLKELTLKGYKVLIKNRFDNKYEPIDDNHQLENGGELKIYWDK